MTTQLQFTYNILNRLPFFWRKDSNSNTYNFVFAISKVLEDFDSEKGKAELEIFIDTASGSYLDAIGRLFLLARRAGESDTDYRARIKGYFQGIIGGGTIEALKTALSGATGFLPTDVDVDEEFLKEDEEHRFLTTNDYYLLHRRDAIDDSTLEITGTAGAVPYTFIKNTDYQLTVDSRIDWLGATDPDNNTVFSVTYNYRNEMMFKISIPLLPSAFSAISELTDLVNAVKAAGVWPIIYFKFTGEDLEETILVTDTATKTSTVENFFIIDVSDIDGQEVIA